jgi:hypothetical protein
MIRAVAKEKDLAPDSPSAATDSASTDELKQLILGSPALEPE